MEENVIEVTTRDSVPLTTRERTPDGFLLARAAVTAVGVQDYTRRELGLDGDPGERVGVYRTRETVQHPQTRNSFRGRPVVMGHPIQDVTPENARRFSVGSTGDSVEMDGDSLLASVFVHDQKAIELVEAGRDQVSAGYGWKLVEDSGELDGKAYAYRTEGHMEVNHLGLAESNGRLGNKARVLDRDPGDPSTKGDRVSDKNEGADSAKDAKPLDTAQLVKDVTTAVIAVLDKRAEASKAEDEAADRKAADQKASREAATRRAGLLVTARDVLGDEEYAKVADKDDKDILVAIVGDTIKDAADRPEDYLRAIADVMAADRRKGRDASDRTREAFRGTGTAPKATDAATDMKSARDDYNDWLTGSYKEDPGADAEAN